MIWPPRPSNVLLFLRISNDLGAPPPPLWVEACGDHTMGGALGWGQTSPGTIPWGGGPFLAGAKPVQGPYHGGGPTPLAGAGGRRIYI